MNMLARAMAENQGAANPLLAPTAVPAGQPAAPPANATPWMQKMHGMAGAYDRIAANPLFGEMPSGNHPQAYERMRAMMMAVKDLSKHVDPVLGELARVGQVEGHVPHAMWEHVRDEMHEELRGDAADMRDEIRRPENHDSKPQSPHTDIRATAQQFAEDARGIANDEGNRWIARDKGDDQDLHPDDIDALAEHAEGVRGSLQHFLDHMMTSHKADWRSHELRDDRQYHEVPRHLREHKVHPLPENAHEDLREKANEVREEMEE